MKRAELQASFMQTGGYCTPFKVDRDVTDRLLGWSDTWYYIRLTEIVMRGALDAKLGRYKDEQWGRDSLRTWELVEGCGGRICISGIRHAMECPGPKVYVANHMSLLETFLLPGVLLCDAHADVVVKESLLTYPVFGNIMRAVSPISVTRQNARQDLKDVMAKGQAALQAGRAVLIFPQHTRSPLFDSAQFNTLGTKLADRAGVPVIPLVVKTDFMGIGKRLKDFGRIDRGKAVHLKLGAPIRVDGNVRQVQQAVVDFITSHLRQWGGCVKDADAAQPATEE